MFQRLQKETECEEKKLEASKGTLKEQQQQLEKELTEQKSKLDQVLAEVLVAEERVRALRQEERWSETLEKTLSQTSTCAPTRCPHRASGEGPARPGRAPGRRQERGGKEMRPGVLPALQEDARRRAQGHGRSSPWSRGSTPRLRSSHSTMSPSPRRLPRGRETFRQRASGRHSEGFL